MTHGDKTCGPIGPRCAGSYVRMRNGVVGQLLWAYENPVHRPGFLDRAAVNVEGRTWSANLGDLRPA